MQAPVSAASDLTRLCGALHNRRSCSIAEGEEDSSDRGLPARRSRAYSQAMATRKDSA